MNVLSPYDNPVHDDKSSMTDTNFGGHREHSQVSDPKDYTKRTGASPNKKENPEDAVKDIDDLSNSTERKREFSYQNDKADVQSNNEDDFVVQSDSSNRPRMDEGSDAVQSPEGLKPKRHRKPNQWQLGTESVYDGEIS